MASNGSPRQPSLFSHHNGTAPTMARAIDLTDRAFMSRPKVRIRSTHEIRLISLMTAIASFGIALGLQWLIYNRLLHQDGLRFVGSVISGGLAAILVYTMAIRSRRGQIAELRRMEIIALMNHHIRNSLQAIVYCSGTSESANVIRDSVNRIEWVLSEVLPGMKAEEQSAPNSRGGE
jgi:hypothetical protein